MGRIESLCRDHSVKQQNVIDRDEGMSSVVECMASVYNPCAQAEKPNKNTQTRQAD